jgi:hypothetical protein
VESGYDFVKVYAGTTTSSPLLGSYTGVVAANTQVSVPGGIALFVFTSDSSVNRPGFVVSYQQASRRRSQHSDLRTMLSGIGELHPAVQVGVLVAAVLGVLLLTVALVRRRR